MLQDLDFGYLDNHYYDLMPADNDIVVCVQGKNILVSRAADNQLSLPAWKQVREWSNEWTCWFDEPLKYVFELQGKKYFLWMGQAGDASDDSFKYESAMILRQMTSKNVCFGIMTA